MGLQKSVEFKNTGIMLNYWRINCVETDIEANRTKCRVGGYVEKADALAGKGAVHNLFFDWPGAKNPIGLQTDPRDYQSLLYTKISAQPGQLETANPLTGAEIVADTPDEEE